MAQYHYQDHMPLRGDALLQDIGIPILSRVKTPALSSLQERKCFPYMVRWEVRDSH